MAHVRYEIWEEPTAIHTHMRWRAQMVDYVAQFPSKEFAEKYVAAVQAHRKKAGLKN